MSRALHDLCGCEKTYVVQFAEHPDHRHVHVHLIPRSPDLADERRGPRIFGLLGVPETDRVSEDDMNDFAASLRRWLTASDRQRDRGDDLSADERAQQRHQGGDEDERSTDE